MKQKLTIIFIFLSLTGYSKLLNHDFGFYGSLGGEVGIQSLSGIPIPKTNLDFYWDGGISSIDSTLFNQVTGTYDSKFKLLSFDGSLTNDYLSTKSTTFLLVFGDTVHVTCLFQNYNVADTLFFKKDNHVLNSDLSETKSQRISEIAYYTSEVSSVDSITLWNYFNVPIATNGIKYVAPSGGDYTTLKSAESGATAGDTIYIKSGIYNEVDYLYLRKNLTYIGIGDVRIMSTGTTYTILVSDNVVMHLENVHIDGSLTDTYGVLVSGTNANTKNFKNCYFSNGKTNIAFLSGTTHRMDNCVSIEAATTGTYNFIFRSLTGNLTYNECYHNITAKGWAMDSANVVNFTYNKILTSSITYRTGFIKVDSIIINNCDLDNYNASGYGILIGSETTSAHANYSSYISITNCRLISHVTSTSHGLMVGFQKKPIVKYNYIEGYGIGLVLKGSNTDNTGGIAMGNIFKNNNVGIYMKGTNNNTIYNNTFYSSINNIGNIRLSINTGSDESTGNVLSNNLFSNTGTGKILYIVDNEDSLGIEGFNNLMYKTDTLFINFETKVNSFTTVDTILTDSYNSNPNFKSSTELWPIATSEAVDGGKNLGVSYDDGLNTTTNYNVSPPIVIFKQQGTLWEIGAYVTNDE